MFKLCLIFFFFGLVGAPGVGGPARKTNCRPCQHAPALKIDSARLPHGLALERSPLLLERDPEDQEINVRVEVGVLVWSVLPSSQSAVQLTDTSPELVG